MAKKLPDVTKLSNWEIVSDWCYKYAVSDSLWYELRIVYWRDDMDEQSPLADLYECSTGIADGKQVYTSMKANGRLTVGNSIQLAKKLLLRRMEDIPDGEV